MSAASRIRLFWWLFVGVLRRLGGRSRGLSRFEARYFPAPAVLQTLPARTEDGARPLRLVPITTAQREALGRLSRCIACGMCDARFSAYDAVNRKELRGPSDLALGYARSLPDLDAVGAFLRNLRRGDLARLERVCPVGVPFLEIADVLDAMAMAAKPPRVGKTPSPPPPWRPRPGPG